MRIVTTSEEARALYQGTVALVPTMGALHGGHVSLLTVARAHCDTLVMSLFVNPLQFDQDADLARYPRDPEGDADLARASGVDVVFAPAPVEMYPRPPLTTVSVAAVTEHMEGARRPGHFAGVAIVVAKLLAALRPDRAYFGRKDHQQLVMVRTMAADLSFPTEIVGCPTVREPDGLALSSRNVFLEDREAALTISQGLMAAAHAVDDGRLDAADLEGIVRARLTLDAVEYVTLASQARAQPLSAVDRPAFLAVAGTVGSVRLIDNLPVDPVGEIWVPDRGVTLPVEDRRS